MYTHRHMLKERFGQVYIDNQGELTALQNTPVKLNFNVENAYDGKALYFREAVKDYIRENVRMSTCIPMV